MKKQLILWSITSALALVGISSNAQAQDACDPNTFDVACVDASIQFCNADSVTETFDCSTAGLGCGAPTCVGECPDLDNCVAANAGDPCALLLADDANNPQVLCGAGLSCSVSVVGQNLAESCIPSAGTCAAGETSAGCAGDTVLLCLGDGDTFSLADAYAFDCTIFGGSCNAGGFCEGAVGAPCDANADSLLKCAAGLECIGAAGQSTCQEPGAVTPDAGTPVDSGTPADDAGTGNNDADAGGRDDEEEEPEPETPAGLCSNAGASTSFMGLSILGLLGALRIRRRR